MLKELVLKNRSYRRFDEQEPITLNLLKECIDLARNTPSAANKQSLKYIIVINPEIREKVFETLSWAGYLKNWDGPQIGERPSGYIIMLNDTTISTNYFCDHGIAAQTILLGATEKGYGGCIIASVDKTKLRNNLQIPEKLEIIQVLAMGKPTEEVKIEPVGNDGDIKYWRDKNQVHHVPKRNLEDIIYETK
jgi:nitroreductase